MDIVLKRFEFGKEYAVGKLLLEGVFECHTLEDVVRPLGEAKVTGATAIPTGAFKVVIDRSERFKRDMPHVLDVPGFTGIRIHSGNTDKDTEGCILVGSWKGGDYIYGSRDAYNAFYSKLQAALGKGESVTLTVE